MKLKSKMHPETALGDRESHGDHRQTIIWSYTGIA